MGDKVCRGVTWDSRFVKPGYLFIALPGERVDGHDFIGTAAKAGAVAALVTHEVDCEGDLCQIVVDDTAAALSDLAAYWRGRLQGKVVGLTGSTGKTTSKNLVRDVLAAAGSVVATEANQNNELGVPNTLLAADADTDHVVVEMGMRGMGQIEKLCGIAKPAWGLITNVGESHIELLGSRENIAHAKAELLVGLPDERGIAFVNAADDYAAEVCRFAKLDERGVKVVFFDGSGERAHADALGIFEKEIPFVWASDTVLDDEGRPTFTLNVAHFGALGRADADGSVECALELRGLHNVSNACSASAVGLAAGMSLSACCEALAGAQATAGRQQIVHTSAGVTVMDDAYNANPDSMRASLATFAALAADGRHIAVLGDMGELGDFAPECHERVGRMAADAHPDLLICVGELSTHIARSARAAGMADEAVLHFDTVDEALDALRERLSEGDAVLVKASHFMEFDAIVKGLVD